MKFARFYLYPTVKKVYGLEIKSDDEFHRFVMDLQRQLAPRPGMVEGQGTGLGREGQRIGKEWSLRTPEKEEEFWEWFEDDTTGKPIAVVEKRKNKDEKRER